GNRILPLTEGRDASRARERVVVPEDVIGDRDDVEVPRLSIKIDEFADRQPAIAPRRVRMEIAEEKRFESRHARGARRDGRRLWDGGEWFPTRSCARTA